MGCLYKEFCPLNSSQPANCGSCWHAKAFCGHETFGGNNPAKASLCVIVKDNIIETSILD